ncbi:hypothetical protein [Glutamicibacter sp. NPDC090743]|uniref:hypothetical protein n=1 Tax=Glutamicibacter sp. NPDC090743 TaxID=3364001 RepID=UPI0037FCC2A7
MSQCLAYVGRWAPSTGASGNGKLTSKLIPITSANTTVLPVGVQFIEPTVRTDGLGTVLLDEAVGKSWWTLVFRATIQRRS